MRAAEGRAFHAALPAGADQHGRDDVPVMLRIDGPMRRSDGSMGVQTV
jgi:hypothetical protein